MRIHVGCCSKTVAWAKYAELFDTIEINSTFYKLPNINTAKRWIKDTKSKVIFCMKAFQGITHTIDSPTWKRAGSQMPKDNVNNYGHLKPTKKNFDCWDNILKICKAINAMICVIQLPPSFDCNDKNLENALTFFSNIKRDNLIIGIEFRHRSWFMENDKTEMLLAKTNLIHIVDPLAFKLLKYDELIYCRMHGIHNISKNNKILYNYNYEYTNEELKKLKKIIESLNAKEVFVMFNNINMHNNVLKFKSILHVTSSNSN